MTETEKKKAATKFAADWKDRGNEKAIRRHFGCRFCVMFTDWTA